MRAERQVLFWLGALVLLVLAIGLLQDILLPFVIGIAIAYFLSPLVDRLTQMKFNRTLASALIVAAGAALAIALLILLVPLVLTQAQQFAVALPGQLERLKVVIEAWARDQIGPRFPGSETALMHATDALANNWASLAGWAAASLWDRSLAIFNFLSLMLVTPLVVFYLLVDWHPMLAKIDTWLPRDHAPVIRKLAAEMNDAIAAFVRGQGTVCLILGAYYALALNATGLDYGILVGLATGLLAFIPFIGWALGLIATTVLAIAQFWPDIFQLALVVCVYFIGAGLDSGFLGPKIVGSKIGLHPVWLIFALFVFGYLFGVVGLLVAVPVAAAIAVVVRYALEAYLRSTVYRGGGSPVPGGSARATRDGEE
jgi:predicted PurR-regulated permease PerM